MDYAQDSKGRLIGIGAAAGIAKKSGYRDITEGMSEKAVSARLVAAASLMLFVELAFIRWLGSNVIHLSYFSNFVLLGSFLGIGAGFLISRKSWSIWPWSLPLLPAHHP